MVIMWYLVRVNTHLAVPVLSSWEAPTDMGHVCLCTLLGGGKVFRGPLVTVAGFVDILARLYELLKRLRHLGVFLPTEL